MESPNQDVKIIHLIGGNMLENTRLYKKNKEYMDICNKHVEDVIGNYFKIGRASAYAIILNSIQQHEWNAQDISKFIYLEMKNDKDINDCVYELMKNME